MKANSLALLLLVACGAPCGLDAAQSRWYAATGLTAPPARWDFPFAYSVPCSASRLASGALSPVRGAFVGCASPPLSAAVATRAARCSEVTLHEYGHLLGATHHAGRGVMVRGRGRAGYSPRLTRDDLHALCQHAPCHWQRPE